MILGCIMPDVGFSPAVGNIVLVFLTDPKFDMRQNSLDNTFLTKILEPTNVLMLVTDSTKEDVESIARLSRFIADLSGG